ncbi:MAG: SCO family protein [Candidatus Kapabacteria bacterium]|nr:SCO family protein [Candidatus Kapabacteria bacterium]
MKQSAWLALALSVLCSSVFLSCDKTETNKHASSDLPVVKSAPQFSGENFDGRTFTSTSLKGSVWIASFMFTTCGGVCPVMNGHQSALQNEYSPKGVRFVSVSVDPDNDTREALTAYAATYGIAPGSDVWYMLRMPIDSVRSLSVKGFLLSDPVEPSAHSPRFVLIDKEQNIRGYYDSMDSSKVRQLRLDIQKLIQ